MVNCFQQEFSSGVVVSSPISTSITTTQNTGFLNFSTAQANQTEEPRSRLVEQRLVARQPGEVMDKAAENFLGLKKLPEFDFFSVNGLKTQPATPDKEYTETDSHKLKTTLQRNKILERTEAMRQGRFKPCILYGNEGELKGTPYYNKVMIEYILHALQAINVIQRLKPIPQQFIDTHKITLPHISSTSLF